MERGRTRRVFKRNCKGCGKPFTVTEDTVNGDVARGLSAPSRCQECRKSHSGFLNNIGAGYFQQRKPAVPDPRCAGKFGLGYLDHPDPEAGEESYDPAPTAEQLERFNIINPAVEKLVANLENPQGTRVSILVGPTGTGKSVWMPLQLLRSSIGREGRILVTQPRLVTLRAASGKGDDTTTPGFIATKLLGASAIGAGQEIGLLYSGEGGKQDRYTRLLFATDGILIRWILSGQLGRFSVIVIDEAHEQSTNMELIFALLRYHLPLYPRLRLVIASATVDVERFQNYFGNGDPNQVFVAMPEEPATLRTIYDRWPDGTEGYAAGIEGLKLPQKPDEIPAAVALMVKAIRTRPGFTKLGMPDGDMLVFAPTIKLVERCVEAIRAGSSKDVEVLALHAQTEDQEQDAFDRSERRAKTAQDRGQATKPQRIIVATNYAETSVTLSNLRYVIDSGYIMEPCWNPETCSMEYLTRRHSRAGCTQRKGRVGRVLDGEVFRLYTQADFDNPELFPTAPRAAIARESLDQFLLSAKAAGVVDLESFQWLGFDAADARQQQERDRARSALKRRAVIDADGDVTNRGLELEGLRSSSLDWSYAISNSDAFGCSLELATFMAFNDQPVDALQDGDRGVLAHARWSHGCYDDLEYYLRLFHHWTAARKLLRDGDKLRSWAASEGLNARAFQLVERSRKQGLAEFTKKTHTDPTERALDLARLHRVRLILGHSLPEWIFVRDRSAGAPLGQFVPLNPADCPCKVPLFLERDSACALRDDVEAFVCVSRVSVAGKVFARHVVRLDARWLTRLQASLVGLVDLYRETMVEPPPCATNAAARIEALPADPTNLSQFTPGAILNFKVLQYRGSGTEKERKSLLVRELASSAVLLVRQEGGLLDAGDQFRAEVEGPDETGLALRVTQKRIAALYKSGTVISGERVKVAKWIKDEQTQLVRAALVALEPGVVGYIQSFKDERYNVWWRAFVSGHARSVVIRSVEGDRIRLDLYFPELQIGQTYLGVVTAMIPSKGRYGNQGAKILFHPKATGAAFWRTSGQNAIDALYPNKPVWVVLTAMYERNGRMVYDLVLR
ncbi:MAG: hypothetical protein K1X83_09110 [Oligoflexia bacterium]|nr:hypothetical protein [Oligoflexia bacterium]